MFRKWAHGLVIGLLLGSLFVAFPAAQNYVWSSINGVPYAPGLVIASGGTISSPLLTLNSLGNMLFNVGGTTKITLFLSDGSTTFQGTVRANGAYLELASDTVMYWAGRTQISSPSDGVFTMAQLANTGFSTLNLGPLTGNTNNGSWSLSKVHTTINMATATGSGTGTVTSATTALPAGAYIMGVSCRVTTILAGAGLTTWSVGIAGTTDKWGTGKAVTVNTTANIADYKAATTPYFNPTAAGIVFTAAAGVFSTGVVQCTTYYDTFTNIPAV